MVDQIEEDDDDEEIFTDEFTEEMTEDIFDEDVEELEDDEEFDIAEEEEPAQPAQEEVAHTPVEPPPPAAQPVATQVTSQQPLAFSAPLTPGDIPVCMTVEVAQLRLSVQKLLDLQPGNMLDLNSSVENGVYLVANGKIVGRGELIKIGETLGVRIIEIGNQACE